MNNMKELLRNYYKNNKKKTCLGYEIEELRRRIDELEKFIDSENIQEVFKQNIKERILKNFNMIAVKNIEIDNLTEDIINIKSIISRLNKEDEKLCELRFGRGCEYQSIVYEMSMSKSTICRRIQSILKNINEELELTR